MRAHAHRVVLAALSLSVTLAVVVASPPARAGVDADVRAGVFTSADNAVGVGAGILTPIGDRNYRWYANPNAEFAVGNTDENLVSVNGDFHYDLAHQRTTSVWVGAGPAVIIQDRHGDSNTDLGLNLLAGMGKTRGTVRPYGQVKGVLSDNSGVAIVGGVRF
ncbi:MAG TPA: hypothetical protein VL123_03155 [Candidatus Udaeobacter sp.]|jgi:hypothetical protein|nr:hypothetical protein [Candidatus Udaeobacter sp.]